MREHDVLSKIFALNTRLPRDVLLPPGDDMAMLACPGASQLLVAADSAIEGQHTPWGCDPYLIGRKAVLRNVSDVAAMMNARTLATVACVTLPRDTEQHRIWRLFEGLRETAERWGAPLIGGDIATMPSGIERAAIVVSVTILAVPLVTTRGVATRGDARVGDGIYVTGTIGGAWDADTGLGRHLDFTPRIAVAHGLVESLGDRLGAAIDVSDGLGRDLGHIALQSRCGMEIELSRLPITAGFDAQAAIGHGEDYELAFTARGEVPKEIAGIAITRIGDVVSGAPRVMVRAAGGSFDASLFGFEHGDAGVRR